MPHSDYDPIALAKDICIDLFGIWLLFYTTGTLKRWHKVIPRCGQPSARPWGHPIISFSKLFQYFVNISFTASNILFCDIYIDNVNGQSKIISKRGREERRWWQEARDEWGLREFLGNKRCDMSVPMMKDLGLALGKSLSTPQH